MSHSRRFAEIKFARILGVAAVGSLLAACSTDFNRFTDYPAIDTGTSTASLSKPETDKPDTVTSAPLDNNNLSNSKPAWQNGSNDRPRGFRTRNDSFEAQPASGTVVVKPGQTLYSIARANGQTVQQLAAANHLSAPYNVTVGQRLKVPGSAAPVSPQASFDPKVVATGGRKQQATNFGSNNGGLYTVQPGDTLFSIGRKYNVHPYEIAKTNRFPKSHNVRVGEKLAIPGHSSISARRSAQQQVPFKQVEKQPVITEQPKPEPVETPRLAEKQELPPLTQPNKPVGPSESAAAPFRWPVRGKLISKFGQDGQGRRNEGINIAVPEGTSVRSAEDGVVAYSGDELKGYGNLLLIRHENGWVTAYAHNKELFVKRGDTVRRGDVIAKAGRTGSVETPQVHFELRKGATAVDPLKHLPTSTASN